MIEPTGGASYSCERSVKIKQRIRMQQLAKQKPRPQAAAWASGL